MAASDNLSEQFKDHNAMIKTLLANVESAHDIDINPMGARRGDGRPLPLTDIQLFGSSISGRIPHEDPERVDRINLWPRREGDADPETAWTHEAHGYPMPGSTSKDNPEGQVHRIHRFTHHLDLDSADRHFKAAGEERQRHLEAGTIPESGRGTSWSPAEASDSAPATDTPMRLPNTMQYFADPISSDEFRTVDTGTRNIIPDKDY